MVNKVLIVQNSHEGPGIIGQVLEDKQIVYDLVKLNAGDIIPSPKNYKAIVVLGGPDSANDQSGKMLGELARIQEALDCCIPVLGICLGCQILVKLAGGKIIPGDVLEIGLRDPHGNPFQVHLTDAGKKDPLFEELGGDLRVFELHGEILDLTSDIQLLGVGSFVRNQIVKVADKSYGILCHFEIIPEELKDWFAIDSTFDAIDREQLIEDFEAIQEEYQDNGRKLIGNFLRIVGL